MTSRDTILTINRAIDILLTFFNTVVAIALLIAPWYKVTEDTDFHGCTLAAGTVLAPFASGLCTYDSFYDLPVDGSKWEMVYIYGVVFLSFNFVATLMVVYESVNHGVREWDNANTASFIFNIVSFVIAVLIQVETSTITKPLHLKNETAQVMVIIALVVCALRTLMLSWFMYETYHNDRRGFFGTGSHM